MLTGIIDLTALLEYLDMIALLELIFILSTIVVLAMLLKVILVNFNESILKITQIIMIIIMTMMMCFILSWQDVGIVSIVSSNNLQQ